MDSIYEAVHREASQALKAEQSTTEAAAQSVPVTVIKTAKKGSGLAFGIIDKL